jgi:hypothetical protein
MLSDFPKIKRKLQEGMTQYLQDLVRQDPLLSQIKHEHHFEGNRMSMKTENGVQESSGYKEISGGLQIKKEDIITKGPGAFIENIQKMAEEIQKKQVKFVLNDIKEITDKTGHVVNGKGQPFTFELFMELFKKIWIDFDDQGNPYFPTLVISPEMGVKIKDKLKEWESNPEYRKKFEELIEQKRKEWNDRESHRKLVD